MSLKLEARVHFEGPPNVRGKNLVGFKCGRAVARVAFIITVPPFFSYSNNNHEQHLRK